MAAITDASEVINRIKGLKYFRVERDVESIPMFGRIPYDVKHIAGGPLEVKLLAVSQGRTARRVEPSRWRRETISSRVIVDARTGEDLTLPGGTGAGDKVDAGGCKAVMDSAIERSCAVTEARLTGSEAGDGFGDDGHFGCGYVQVTSSEAASSEALSSSSTTAGG